MSHPSNLRRHCLIAAVAAAVAWALPAAAQTAADWKPDKAVKLLVGFAAGGSADTLARLLADPLAKALGQPVVVENVAGASGNIMATRLANAAPDGLTIAIGAAGAMSINYDLNPRATPYKPTSFTPITLLATQPNVVLLNNSAYSTPSRTPFRCDGGQAFHRDRGQRSTLKADSVPF